MTEKPRSISGIDVIMFAAAVVAVAALVLLDPFAFPHWNPITVTALLILPAVIRFGMVIESGAGTLRVSTAPVLLFASAIDQPLHFLPFWSLVVLGSNIAFSGPWRGLGRGSVEVLAGAVMVAVARLVDTAIWPLDRALTATAVFIACMLTFELIRAGARNTRGLFKGVRRGDTVLVVGGLVLASSMVALLRKSYESAPSVSTGLAGGGFLVTFVVARSVMARLQSHVRGVEVLTEAGTAMPWPADHIDAMLVRFVDDALRALHVRIQAQPGPAHELALPLPGRGYIVAHRTRGDFPFTRDERRVMSALVSMADTSRRQAQQDGQLRRQATTDDLTGLTTYAHFRYSVEASAASRSSDNRTVVAFLDLDGFKALNSTIGHFESDEVLATIGRRCRDELPADIASSRFGGDEFIFLATGINDKEAVDRLVAQITAAVEAPMSVADRLIQVRGSLGVATSTNPHESLDLVVRRAETRMRASKKERRSPVTRSQAEVLTNLLAENLFTVVYQPMVSVRTGEVYGIEALVRVADQTFGQLSPLLVVDTALRFGLIDEVTEVVARQSIDVAQQASATLGRKIALTVNVEFSQLWEHNPLIPILIELARTHNVNLALELSERAFETWTDAHSRVGERLRAAGIWLAIDDFGAGYATYGLLNQWSWDLVKIDRSLVSGRNPAERHLLSHVFTLLNELGKVTIAEGIEDADQLDFISDLGIEWAQGWWISPPLTGEELLARLESEPRFPGEADAARHPRSDHTAI